MFAAAPPAVGFGQLPDLFGGVRLNRDFFPISEKSDIDDVEQSARSNEELASKMSASSSAEMKSGPLKEDAVSPLEVRMLLLLSAEKSESDKPSTEEGDDDAVFSLIEIGGNNDAVWSRDKRS